MNNFLKNKILKANDFQQFLTETRGLERDYINEILQSRQKAWWITAVCGVIVILSLIALGILEHTLAKPLPPFILRVNNATGQTDVVSIIKNQQNSYGEVIDKYWLNQYVMNAESYDYHTIQHSYDLVGLLSDPSVAKNYHQRFVGKTALDQLLKDTGTIVVNVHSIVPDEKNGTADVHFSTITTLPGQFNGIQKNWIATIAYQYKNLPMNEADRLKNPLGFQVTSYRVDPEDFNTPTPNPAGGDPA
ncbi:MAG: type IV secretion system protein [Legionellales bacterium]|nr:type IV secretion system protein [Legionellales bacterium]